MLNDKLVREEFGFLGDRIHLYCCAIGVPPVRVQNACKDFYSHYIELVYGKSDGYGPFRDKTREKAARLIGCKPGEIAFCGSTADGLCVLANGFPLGPGDNIVMCDLENTSGMYPWVNAAKNRGFELRIVKTYGGQIHPDELFARADENTKIICLSAVQYGTGFFADLKTIGRTCRARGIVFAVDSIQALGRMVIDVEDMYIDYLSNGGFKGLGAGFGVGLIYCSERIIGRITQAYAGACSVVDSVMAPDVFSADPQLLFHSGAARLETGSNNTIGIVLLDAALDVILDLGPAEIEAHVLALEDRLRRGVEGTKLQFSGAIEPGNRSGLVVAYYPEALYERIAAIFERENMILTHRPGYIRLAMHCYNTAEQVDRVAQAFREMSEMM